MFHPTAKEIEAFMVTLRDETQRRNLMRFFKTGKGDYGEGDEFLGLKVPQTRQVVKNATDIAVDEIPELLSSPYHEVRLCGFLLLVDKFEKQATKRFENDMAATEFRDRILTMYLDNADRANNWDLVDLSAPKILGRWLLLPTHMGARQQSKTQLDDKAHKQSVVDALAKSDNLWRQRISMVCTWMPSHSGDPSWCLHYAEMHLHHPHDLMHKAVGWMLREMGKHCGMDTLRDFLLLHHDDMHRTTLRYAIEKMTPDERKYWMRCKM